MNETTVATKAIATAVEQIGIARQAVPAGCATHRARLNCTAHAFCNCCGDSNAQPDSRSARAASMLGAFRSRLATDMVRQFTAGKLPMPATELQRYARPMSRAFVRENDGARGPPGRAGASRQLARQFRDRARPATDREPDRRARSRARSAEAQRRQGRARARRSRAALLAATQGHSKLVEPETEPVKARFGVRVTLHYEDGTQRSYTLVGEDEADPAQGLISWISPIAQALIGHQCRRRSDACRDSAPRSPSSIC